MDIQQKIEELTDQINELARMQTSMTKKLIGLMDELEQLKKQAGKGGEATLQKQSTQGAEMKEVTTPPPAATPPQTHSTPQSASASQQTVSRGYPDKASQGPGATGSDKKKTLEEFIGGNLTSKVGILITIIGIFIGAKYAIEHNLVNPKVRVILGYINGLILTGVAIRLRKKYEQYSSVLMGGGLAVLYFITYIAYSFYGMLPQVAAFLLMLVFTAATVYASLVYNRIIIAHLGLLGAYAIPFLLSDESGRYVALFTYVAIINAGILALSLKKYWKSLFYAAFALTWLIYGYWFFDRYEEIHFVTAFVFVAAFFVIFYATFLAYKLVRKEQYGIGDVSILLSNAFIFYGIGYSILDNREDTAWMVGLFTVANAFIHLAVSLVIKKLQLADKALFYLLVGLVITFVTIAIPVQLDGNWVTLLWTMEAMLVFFIGRTQGRPGYEKLAVALALLAFASLLDDWSSHPAFTWRSDIAEAGTAPSLFSNIIFFTGLFTAISQAAIVYIHNWKKNESALPEKTLYTLFYDRILPGLLLLTIYVVFFLEIESYFTWVGNQPSLAVHPAEMQEFNFSIILLYTMAFAGLLTYINMRWLGNTLSRGFGIFMIVAVVALFIAEGLTGLNELANFYYSGDRSYFGMLNVLLRYVMMAAAGILLALGGRAFKKVTKDLAIQRIYGALVHVAILAMISYEYLLWMSMGGSGNEYKLGLSIVWSVYALFLVVTGIIRKKKHWRLTGIAFFVITLVKLFTYDLNQTTTISKTISFISLGAILLLVSYLYNRYKHVILAEDDERE